MAYCQENGFAVRAAVMRPSGVSEIPLDIRLD